MKTFGTCHFSLSASPSATTICYSSSLSRETTLSVAFVTINGMYLCVCVNKCVWCMIQTGLLLLLTWPLPSVITFSTLKSSTCVCIDPPCVKTVIIFTVIAFSLPPVNFLPVDVAGVWSLSADSVHRFPSELSVSCQLSVYLPESPLFTRVAAGTAAAWHVRVCVCVRHYLDCNSVCQLFYWCPFTTQRLFVPQTLPGRLTYGPAFTRTLGDARWWILTWTSLWLSRCAMRLWFSY